MRGILRPAADLLVPKDVLQHCSDASIRIFLPFLARYWFSLLINCMNPRGQTIHHDIEDGGFRYLNLRTPPFKLVARHVYTFANY